MIALFGLSLLLSIIAFLPVHSLNINILKSYSNGIVSKYAYKARINDIKMSQSSQLLLCQQDSYLTSSQSIVLNRILNSDGTQVLTLDNTCFYPEGGGQPSDFGSIDGIQLLDISKDNDNPNSTQVIVKIAQPIDDNKTMVLCEIDWKRRYDFMQQHTAQHLLSAIADSLFTADTIGWSLQPESVTVDLQAILNPQQVDELETEINEKIRLGCEISHSVYNKEDLASLELLRGAPKGAAANFNELRIVHIDGLDRNPCGGTHLKSLSEIQVLKIIGIEKDKTTTRVRFVAGHRALDYYRSCVRRETLLCSTLSAPVDEHFNAINKLFSDKREMAKSIKYLSDEVCSSVVSSICEYIQSHPLISYVVYHRVGSDINFLLQIADNVNALCPNIVLYLSSSVDNPSLDSNTPSDSSKKKGNKSSKYLTLEDMKHNFERPYSFTSKDVSGCFVLVGNKELVDNLKQSVISSINGRGGGRPGRLQGTGLNLENIEAVRDVLMQYSTSK